jgi:hypothetical protein
MAGEPEVPAALFAQVERICSARPETTLRTDRWAYAFMIRRRNFAFLMAPEDPSGIPKPMLIFQADPLERRALLEQGHPFFGTRSGNRVGVVLDDDTDWVEVNELVTESYRMLAPQKLVKLLDEPASPDVS